MSQPSNPAVKFCISSMHWYFVFSTSALDYWDRENCKVVLAILTEFKLYYPGPASLRRILQYVQEGARYGGIYLLVHRHNI